MREILFIRVDRIRCSVTEGIDPLLEIIVVERVGKIEVETPLILQFSDAPDEMARDITEAVNAVVEKYKPSLKGKLLQFVKERA